MGENETYAGWSIKGQVPGSWGLLTLKSRIEAVVPAIHSKPPEGPVELEPLFEGDPEGQLLIKGDSSPGSMFLLEGGSMLLLAAELLLLAQRDDAGVLQVDGPDGLKLTLTPPAPTC